MLNPMFFCLSVLLFTLSLLLVICLINSPIQRQKTKRLWMNSYLSRIQIALMSLRITWRVGKHGPWDASPGIQISRHPDIQASTGLLSLHSLASKHLALALHCLSFLSAKDKAVRVRHGNNRVRVITVGREKQTLQHWGERVPCCPTQGFQEDSKVQCIPGREHLVRQIIRSVQGRADPDHNKKNQSSWGTR